MKAPAPAETADAVHPRATAELHGHDAAERTLLDAFLSGRPHHGWLLAGPVGVGKATLAYRFARFVLEQSNDPSLFGRATSLAVDPAGSVARRLAAGSHPDLLTVERGLNARGTLRTEIVVDDAQAVATFLHKHAAEGGWRVVIVDSVDEMNRNAANALLKILEEPPERTLLLLVCHRPGAVLPTIRSRCRRLAMPPLAEEIVQRVLLQAAPGIKVAEAAALAALSDGSAGTALALARAGGLTLQHRLDALLAGLPDIDQGQLQAFADGVSGPGNAAGWTAVVDCLLPRWFHRLATGAPGASPADSAVMARLRAVRPLDRWVDAWDTIAHLVEAAEGLNLDKRQVILDAFFTLADTARSAR